MNKKTLKFTIIKVLIIFTMVITLVVGSLSILSIYNSKIKTLEYNQKQVLTQVKEESNKFLNEIENISIYLNKVYDYDDDILKNLVELNKNITSIIVLDEKGIIVDFFNQTKLNIYKGFDYSNKKYFKEITDSNKSFWSDIFFSTVDETLSISYSFKMDNGKVGVMFLKLTDLENFCKRYQNDDGSYEIRIYDRNGILVLYPDKPEIALQYLNAKQKSVFVDLIEKVQPYTQVVYMSSFDEVEQIGMYDDIKKVGWKIVIRENYTFFKDSLNEILIDIIFMIVIFIICAIYVAIKIARKIFNAIEKLAHNIAEISAGNYDIIIEKTPYSEFDSFTHSFEKMQDEIEKREESLERSLKSFKSLVNSTMEAIIIHEKGICKEVNDVAVKLFGYKNKEEMLGKEFINFVSKTHQENVRDNFLKETEPYEVEFIKKDGTPFITLAKGKFLDVFGRSLKVSTIIDITELKHKDKLIFQQSKMAAMGEMIGNIAHQWRQPLSSISTAASGIKLHKELGILTDKDFGDAIDSIVKSTKYLSRTIDDFRNFFKTDKEKERFELSKVMENVLSLISSSFKNYDIEVQKEYKDNIFVMGYQNELTQAFINILNNAKDVLVGIDDDFRFVFIKIYEKDDSAYISIKDTGGGIKEEVMSSIFEPYFTTKHKSQGTGIGLYMTHQIISSHFKGEIEVNNITSIINGKELIGAEFIIKLKKS